MTKIRAFWWRERRNYGDYLTPLLIEKFLDKEPEWASPDEAEIVVIGSILDLLPQHWKGTVLGAGKLHEETVVRLPGTRILALRGHLSRKGVHGDFALGDPGLLASEFIQEPEKKYDLTVVPHWSDKVLAKRFAHLHPHVVDPATDTEQVVRTIAASKKIVASSLHGIIVADSFGIPRRAEKFPNIYAHYEGGEFKYHDYASVLNEEMMWGVLHTPNERFVERAQAELFDVFRSIASGHGHGKVK